MSETHVEVRELTMAFGARVVQQDIGFRIRRGEIFVIMGDSGCGKSTLMRHMIGLHRPARGEVFSTASRSGRRTRARASASRTASACSTRTPRSGAR
jgi:phospholipid/cholesterol/gamma-HCH transport system ATP-binding protein